VKPNHGTTTLGFIFEGGVIIAVDSRASQGGVVTHSRGVSDCLHAPYRRRHEVQTSTVRPTRVVVTPGGVSDWLRGSYWLSSITVF
jgi:hypothetical protein